MKYIVLVGWFVTCQVCMAGRVSRDFTGTLVLLGPSEAVRQEWIGPVVTNARPFAASFENQPTGKLINGASGWMMSPADLSVVEAAEYAYSGGDLPLPASPHTKVLRVSAEGGMLGVMLDPDASANRCTVDLMASFLGFEVLPDLSREAPLAALGADLEGNVVLYAARRDSLDDLVPDWFVLTPGTAIAPDMGDWRRMTLDVSRNEADSHPYVRVLLDGVALEHATAGHPEPGAPATGGCWFLAARTEDSLVASLGLMGIGAVDDVCVASVPESQPARIQSFRRDGAWFRIAVSGFGDAGCWIGEKTNLSEAAWSEVAGQDPAFDPESGLLHVAWPVPSDPETLSGRFFRAFSRTTEGQVP